MYAWSQKNKNKKIVGKRIRTSIVRTLGWRVLKDLEQYLHKTCTPESNCECSGRGFSF